jgi:membrane protein YqaA with SNARE-associated domain
MKKMFERFQQLEKYVCRWWYGPVLFLAAGIDHYVIFIPTVGLMVSSVFLTPKRWLSIALWTACGSCLGAWLLGVLAQQLGLSVIESYLPKLLHTPMWDWAHGFFSSYGAWVVFVAGLAPFPQQPAVVIAAIAGTPLVKIGVVLLIANTLKFGFLGYLASHAPQKLNRIGEVRDELDKLHIEPPNGDNNREPCKKK